MKSFLFFVVFLLSANLINAEIFTSAAGGKSLALGNQVSNVSDVFAAQNNPAGLGFIHYWGFGVSSERKFITDGLDLINASMVMPTATGTFGLSANYFGKSAFNQKMIALSFGKQFGKKFSTGVKFDYINFEIEEYGQKNIFTFDIGFQYIPIEKLLLSAHLFNPLSINVEKVFGEDLPTIMRFGLNYIPVNKVQLSVEIEKDLDFKPNFKAGISYQLAEKIYLRGGINSYPLRGTFGVGIDLKKIMIDFAGAYQERLGTTPQISLQYIIPKKEKNKTTLQP